MNVTGIGTTVCDRTVASGNAIDRAFHPALTSLGLSPALGVAMKARELLDQGDLGGAIGSLNEELKGHPTDQRLRIFLFELLSYAGDFDRAERQLEVLRRQAQGVEAENGVRVYHDLLEAERARARLFEQGQAPRFLIAPGEEAALHLEALEWARQGQTGPAREVLERAAALATPVHCTCGETRFDSIRDADDLLGPVLEVFSGPTYYWLPWAHLQYLEIPRVRTLRDLLWVPAKLATFDGQLGEVFLPNLYPGTASSPDDLLRLGRKTDWIGEETGIVRGIGRKLFLTGEEARTLPEMDVVRFTWEGDEGEAAAASPEAPRAPGDLA